jgi:hypothetical protein
VDASEPGYDQFDPAGVSVFGSTYLTFAIMGVPVKRRNHASDTKINYLRSQAAPKKSLEEGTHNIIAEAKLLSKNLKQVGHNC